MLQRVKKDFPETKNIITWSDSCVPQNRNQMMTFAVQHFLYNQNDIKTVTMKYCTPGHSAIQEVDNIHSQIEKRKRLVDFYSPVSLLRDVLLRVSSNMSVLQIRENNICEYSRISNTLSYSVIPFTSVTALRFTKNNPMIVDYKCGSTDEFHSIKISRKIRTRSGNKNATLKSCDELKGAIPKKTKVEKLPAEKIKDLTSMMPFMPIVDQQFYKAVIKRSEQ